MLIVLSLLSIVGCGPKGDVSDDNSNEINSGHVSLSVSDSYEAIQLNSGIATIDLESNTVASNSSSEVKLSQILQIGDDRSECDVVDIEDTYFQIDTETPKSCDYYVYMTVDGDKDAIPEKASVRVLVSDLKNATAPEQLPALSMTVEKSECKQLNVVDALSGQVDLSDYTLDDDITTLGGGGDVTANVAGTNVIEFCGLEASVNQIYYSMTSSDGESKTAGVLSASVSTDTSIAPQADNFSGPVTKPNIPITIDVCASGEPDSQTSEDCHIATELEDAKLQVIGVYSYDSTVAVLDKSDIANTAFTFEAENLGSYDVSYMISDHRGGYDVGVTRIVVTDEPQLPGWEDITLADGTVYKAPLTVLTAEMDGKSVEDTYIDMTPSGVYEVAIYGYDNAVLLCESYGMSLPTLSQMQDLYSEVGDVSSNEGWPVGKNYWLDASAGSDDFFSINLSDQVLQTEPSNADTRNVTCVEPAVTLSLSSTKNNGVAMVDKNEVTATITKMDGTPVVGEEVSFEAVGGWAYSLDSTATTDSSGNATVSFGSLSAGTYTMRASYQGLVAETQTTFITDSIVTVDIEGPSKVDTDNSIQLTLEAYYASGDTETVTSEASWSSSKTAIATVSDSGRVVGKSVGTTKITATYQGKSSTHNVTVEQEEGSISLSFVDGSTGTKTIYVPSGEDLYIHTPWEGHGSCEASNRSLEGHSSNTSVAMRVGYTTAYGGAYSWRGSQEGTAKLHATGNGQDGCYVGLSSNKLTVNAEYK